MNILVFNCGSSSLNYKVYRSNSSQELQIVLHGKAHRVGVKGSEASYIEHQDGDGYSKETVTITNHRQAGKLVLDFVMNKSIKIDVIGHRFVHGGSYFQKSTMLNLQTMQNLKSCLPLAPIHNPNSLSVIEECRQVMPDVPEYLTFDTAFHADLPAWAYTYPLPISIVQSYGLRKYGFHGLSYQFVTKAAADFLGKPLNTMRMIACHLGTGGSSVAAVKDGHSIDTSMGYSPLAGLMMSTRTGDLDPMVPVFLMKKYGYTPETLTDCFNKNSGILGISGFSSDLRDILRRQQETGDESATLAFEMYTYRLKKVIGSYITILGGIDALIFTDDIGVSNWQVREHVCHGLEWAGIVLDPEPNRLASPSQITQVSQKQERLKVLTVPTDEERVIAHEGIKLMQGAGYANI
ncbi:MAG: acetate/propionate family kinase [Anaerolineaceae bacterium]|nr:acetate/propionate family kinase [Anaerolineaceae bacterium]